MLAAVKNPLCRRHDFCFQRSRPRNDLEQGSGRIHGCNGTVLHRMIFIINNLIPVSSWNSFAEAVRIITWFADHSQYAAVRINRYSRSSRCINTWFRQNLDLGINRILCSFLQVGIKCQSDIVSGNGRCTADITDRLPRSIDFNCFWSVFPFKVLVVFPFDSGSSDQSCCCIWISISILIIRTGFTNVSKYLRSSRS